jgi:phage tail sheath protein FI
LAALSNADEFDFNLITVPGINYNDHPYVASLVIEVCENRGDAFYIMDIAHNQMAGAESIQTVIDLAAQFDTNYAATYYPWVKIQETNSNKIMPVPPSVVMMSVFAANDKVSAEWFAPAGLNRGGIPTAVQVADRLTHTERDSLYENHINPIAAFPGQGVVAWGQKTLQRNPSALDRINVRRLLIALKKFIASSSRFLVFEQNVSTTRQRFLNIVNPYLESVQQRSGIYSFKVVMDETNNTPDLVDRGILYGQIYIQPTRTAEFIVLDFNVMPTGASFPTA